MFRGNFEATGPTRNFQRPFFLAQSHATNARPLRLPCHGDKQWGCPRGLEIHYRGTPVFCGPMKSIVLLSVLAFFQSAPSSLKTEQGHVKKQNTPTQEASKSSTEASAPITTPVKQPPPSAQTNDARDKSNGWPAWGDIFWPSWALVIVTVVAVRAALKTLGSINAQVDEMRKTGAQTDKLIAENIAQSQVLRQQAEFLGKSAYHLGESVAEANRSASAMESIAKEISVSSKAALASVTAINQQMRAYLCVIIGAALYQERAKSLKFQAVPSIVNAGLTPAHKVSFRASAAILPIPLPEDFGFPLPPATSGTSVIGLGKTSLLVRMLTIIVMTPRSKALKAALKGRPCTREEFSLTKIFLGSPSTQSFVRFIRGSQMERPYGATTQTATTMQAPSEESGRKRKQRIRLGRPSLLAWVACCSGSAICQVFRHSSFFRSSLMSPSSSPAIVPMTVTASPSWTLLNRGYLSSSTST